MSIDFSERLSRSSDAELSDLIGKLQEYKHVRSLTADLSRNEFRQRYPTPGALAKAYLPRTRQTPALDAIDAALVQLADAPEDRGRSMIFMAPQEGKSTRVSCWFPLWLLAQDPSLRIAIVSYSAEKAERWGKWLRRMIEAQPDLGVTLMSDSRAVNNYETTAGGRVLSVGISGGITGEPVDVLVIDDPFAGRAEAESPTYRERAWRWWESDSATRLSERGRVVLMMCMTGDTPVLLPDGTEKPLCDVRPGDEVATYEDGQLTTSTVMNWANQGPDDLFRIKMKSGRVVRANARHPFLTINANGRQSWLRTDQIKPGKRILTATGGNGAESPAPPMDAIRRLNVKECAAPTTARLAGRLASAPPRSTHPIDTERVSNAVTNSPTKRSTYSSTVRVGIASSAASLRRTATPEPTGTGSCASTTTMTLARFADCSVTTATSPSDTGNHPQPSGPPLTTWNVTPDEVVAVEPCGREDVFDLQIARTENFIANGLVSHNTRWHADDLAGRLLKNEPGEWRVLRIPAVRDPALPLVRGRDGAGVYAPNGELISARQRRPGYFLELKAKRSLYVWNSIYRQTPVAAEGNLFHRDDFRYWTALYPDRSHHDPLRGAQIMVNGVRRYVGDMTRFITMDLAATTKTSADWTVAAVWGITLDGELILLDRSRERIAESAHWALLAPLCHRWACPDVYVEAGFIGSTLTIDATRAGIRVQPVKPDKDKITRALPATQRVKAHSVYFPDSSVYDWHDEWCDEIAGFPTWPHDDQLDTFSYAARIVSAHWNPPPVDPDRGRRFEPTRRTDDELAYEAATGMRGGVDFMRADW